MIQNIKTMVTKKKEKKKRKVSKTINTQVDDILSGLLQKEFENQLFFVEMHVSKTRGEHTKLLIVTTVEARCKLLKNVNDRSSRV